MVQGARDGISQCKPGPAEKSENILVFYQKAPLYNPQFTYGNHTTESMPAAAPARTMENLSGRAPSPAMGGAIREMCFLFPTVTGGIHPTQSPWSCASISSRPTPGPASCWLTSARAPAQPPLPPSMWAAALSAFETAPAFYAAASERIRVARAAVKSGEKGV